MLDIQFAVYLGKEREDGFSGFIVEDNFCFVLEVEEGLSSEKGREVLDKLKKDTLSSDIKNLAELDEFLAKEIKEINLPSHFSLTSAILKEDVFYLKTIGNGEIYLRRNQEFAKIISKANTASGYVEINDFYIFTTSSFTEKIGGEENIKEIFNHKDPSQIVDALTPELKGKDDKGIIALFLKLKEQDTPLKEEIEEKEGVEEKEKDQEIQEKENESMKQEEKTHLKQSFFNSLIITFRNKINSLGIRSEGTGKKKILTFVIVAIIAVILVWSVVMGNKRRNEKRITKLIENTREVVDEKLTRAEDNSYLNVSKSLSLISESRAEVDKLINELGDKRKDETVELLNLIKEKENEIMKKELKESSEFFDLAVDNKQAEGSKMYLNEDTLAILDKSQGIIYSLSMSKKSYSKSTHSEIKQAKYIATYGNYFLVFTKGGVYKASDDGKIKLVIEKDKNWESIGDMWIFNGNVYLLDAGGDEVYKYLVAEKGYSQKSSYFGKGQSVNLNNANSMAIDSSIYIGFKDYGLKYTGGLQDGFSTSFPEKDVSIKKWFTNKESNKVYAWNKEKAAVYILDKSGAYEREINSDVFKNADDIISYKDDIYALYGSKIFKVSSD